MNLAQLIRKWRFALELDHKDAATIIGIDIRALRALETNGTLDPANVGKIIAWLFSDGPAKDNSPTMAAVGTNTTLSFDGHPVESLQDLEGKKVDG